MKFTLENIPANRYAYFRQIGAYGHSFKAMETLKNWAQDNQLMTEKSVILGIAWDNTETAKPEDCRYDACILISEDQPLNQAEENKLEGGKYAIFEIDHTSAGVSKAYTEIFPTLNQAELIPDDSRPILERYRSELVLRDLCEICVPIR